jgi:hypothetical protein
MRVRVFRNLTSRCYSVQAQVFNDRNRLVWRTVAHADSVTLADCRFRVSEAGRRRVLATGKKTVHAWIAGDLVALGGVIRPAWHLMPHADIERGAETPTAVRLPDPETGFRLVYNPRKAPTFMVTDATPNAMATVGASTVHLSADGATAWFPTVNLFGDRAATTEA